MTDMTKDIDRAAQEMMDAVSPESMRRFFEDYPVDARHEATPSAAHEGAAAPSGRAAPRTFDSEAYSITLSTEELAAEVNFNAFADAIAQSVAHELKPDEVTKFAQDLRAHFASKTFQGWFTAQIKDEPFTRLSQQLAELSRRIRTYAISYDHLLAFDDLRTALLRGTVIKTVLPNELFPKRVARTHKNTTFVFTQPLGMRRRKMIATLIDFLLDYAAAARYCQSDSERDWKAAYLLALHTSGGPWATNERTGKAFPKKEADRLVELISTAYYGLFADISVGNQLHRIWVEGAQ